MAEIGLEQVVRDHGMETGVDDPSVALADLVHRRLHVVVNAALVHPAQCGKRPVVGVEQHLVTLPRIPGDKEGAAGTQLSVRCNYLAQYAADHQRFFAPVERERFSQFEFERHEGGLARNTVATRTPRAHPLGHPTVTAAKPLRADRLEQHPRSAPIPFRVIRVNLEHRRAATARTQ